uniref:UspA domain-containing protein n=1 Tax=Chromera velia CCMP2878 TaxID=1169474 RepID=A0A0G4G5E4_9ALVE|mmetsp:Transcript_26559/g.52150  ORF Transcript_26559/g.52150 Transcript_26559/m.52150 type:complete len:228 (+) Transcript_26559:153-836(+)|eukprot:Cvel_546.t1-p1 / transcript=Cvel_546.t1 / gene=Cvel_546 / organism=Chromera_velia_CCMP2878 / gene_product=Universal stress protein A-like protein, putative / transcript_product=Universal stress protein A-like protein, putative / location=Cvel_scaffold17:48838-50910(+) / protein_length=227 / sequence_SO=supercontig / SO=protein_coding / is_pseudo=false
MPERDVKTLIAEVQQQVDDHNAKTGGVLEGKVRDVRKSRVVTIMVDPSEYSQRTIKWAVEHLEMSKTDSIVLCCVWERMTMEHLLAVDPYEMALGVTDAKVVNDETIDRQLKPRNEAMHAKMSKMVGELGEMMTKAIDEKLKRDHPDATPEDLDTRHPAIIPLLLPVDKLRSSNLIGQIACDAAAGINSDLLIVGCRGLGAFKRFFMGSVSRYVVEHASVPVMVVKD